MIQCKRLYEPVSVLDGCRVLVDRLWPRGIAKTSLVMDEWCQSIAPPASLRRALHRQEIDFTTFSREYRHALQAQPEDARRLAALAQCQTVTLLYAAKDTRQNHALVLAGYLQALSEK